MIENFNLKQVYSSSKDNLLSDFYNPVLAHALEYDRITGYFSPKILAVAARGLSKMITNGGKIRIITSVQVDYETYESLEASSVASAIFKDKEADCVFDINDLEGQLQRDYLKLFVLLLKNNVIELKIAATVSGNGILHEKIGIIKDLDGKSLSFSGSNNETVYGWTKNVEQFKVFPEWNTSTVEFYRSDKNKFEEYWDNRNESVKVLSVDEAFKQNILQVDKYNDDIEKIALRISDSENKYDLSKNTDTKIDNGERKPRQYQLDAIDYWKSNHYVSIFEMATGSGKTFTALNALKQFKIDKGFLRCVIVVPLITIVEQWGDEISSVIDSVTIIVAAGSNPSWRRDIQRLIQSHNLGVDQDFIIITTYSTFSSQNFTDIMDNYPNKDVILLADEMHNLVTENNIRSASSEIYNYKLGLSATPTRLWKQEESAQVRFLFGGCSFVYSLGDAIKDGSLVEYEYHILPVHLTEEEFEEYLNLSKEASKLSHYNSVGSSKNNSLATVLTKRSAIKKHAENKLFVLERLVDRLRKNGGLHNTLIYVDTNSSLTNIQKMLTEKHIKSSKFTGIESIETRNDVIRSLDSREIEAIVAIKCLDEGVDIPSATTGIFLSNNTDPREYIQRLGRVLRKHDKSNKKIAYIYDFLVLPPGITDTGNQSARNLVKSEVIRASFFKELAKNSDEIKTEIGSVLDLYHYYFETDELIGYNANNDKNN